MPSTDPSARGRALRSIPRPRPQATLIRPTKNATPTVAAVAAAMVEMAIAGAGCAPSAIDPQGSPHTSSAPIFQTQVTPLAPPPAHVASASSSRNSGSSHTSAGDLLCAEYVESAGDAPAYSGIPLSGLRTRLGDRWLALYNCGQAGALTISKDGIRFRSEASRTYALAEGQSLPFTLTPATGEQPANALYVRIVWAPSPTGASLCARYSQNGRQGEACFQRTPFASRLSETGLFTEDGRIAPDMTYYEPAYPLWTDGAQKQRWAHLPADAQIDTSDMDHWKFPVGTVMFKEFAYDGFRYETRLIERLPDDGENESYWFGAFIWNTEQTEAFLTPRGEDNVFGTEYDVPSMRDCTRCHEGERGRFLGFSAIQLSNDALPLTIASLVDAGLLSDPPSQTYAVPGTPLEASALGYLHGNCAHCHNPEGNAGVVSQNLRLSWSDSTASSTATYQTAVNQKTEIYETLEYRVLGGDPGASAILYRMSSREKEDEMPTLGTEYVDEEAVQVINDWILTLAPPTP